MNYVRFYTVPSLNKSDGIPCAKVRLKLYQNDKILPNRIFAQELILNIFGVLLYYVKQRAIVTNDLLEVLQLHSASVFTEQ